MKKHTVEFDIRRRALLKGGMAVAAIGAVAATGLLTSAPARAQAKASKATMMYQSTPHGKDACANCIHFAPGKTPKSGGNCNVVEGSISPSAWCVAYAAKG